MAQLSSSRGTTYFARLLAAVVLIGGFVASLAASRISQARHDQEIRRVFDAESASMRNLVSRQIDLFFDVLHSIGQLHDLSDQISEQDFAEFTRKGMAFQQRVLSAYGFVQRMPHDVRAATDALLIVEPADDGSFATAGIRPEYFPLVYQNPADSLAIPVGTDLATLPGLPDAILRMIQRDGPVLARAIRLQGPSGDTGFFALSPLYQTSPEKALSGFTVSVLWPQQILEQALANVATRDVLVRFYDPGMHESPPADQPAAQLQVVENIAVADAEWRFEARASDEYLQARRSALPPLILTTGSAITLLLSVTIGLLAGRTRRIERAVTERTSDLKKANELLSEAMHDRMRLESEILEISEREKQQVGQDLHDSLGQKLTGAVFLSRALAGHLKQGDLEAGAQAVRINEILKESVAQVRRMARGLSPVDLGEDGIAGALQRLADETSSVYGITCVFQHSDDVAGLSPKAAHHLYAIAMEAVNNAVRHGQAKEVVIEWGRTDQTGRLGIEDDGQGFDPNSTQRGGMGLRIMKYRATMIDGHLDITRRPSGGMHITCHFPLNEHLPKAT